jgi:hypothetical protein
MVLLRLPQRSLLSNWVKLVTNDPTVHITIVPDHDKPLEKGFAQGVGS